MQNMKGVKYKMPQGLVSEPTSLLSEVASKDSINRRED